MNEEIKAQIFHSVKTPSGPVTHGMQFDFGSYQSNIVCIFCLNRNKLHTSETLKEHARHMLKEHPEILLVTRH